MTANTTYFKRFGNAASLACDLFNVRAFLEAAQSQETKDNLLEVWQKRFENCEWRKAYVNEEHWVGTKVWRFLEKCTDAERMFRYLTVDEILFDHEIAPFLSLLDELNITEFVFADNSTACVRNLTAFLDSGWKIAGTKVQTYKRHGEQRTVSGLLIKKAKKSN